jgi:membrane associated rhomboid family serine protease
MFNQGFNTRSVVFNLILINIIMFLITLATGDKMYEWCALFYPASPLFKPLQIVGHMFMHGSFMHIFTNMFALFMFGAVLERVWGPQRFLIFYFITGLGAAALHTGVQAIIVHNFTGSFAPPISTVNEYTQVAQLYQTPTVGASGAIFGVLVAFGMLFPNSEIMLLIFPIPIKAKYFVSLYVLFELYLGFSMNPGDNVAHFAHLGGALFGFLLVKYWNRNKDYLY